MIEELGTAHFHPDDIAIGGTVIYKAGTGFKMSKASVKIGNKIRLANNETIGVEAVVSTDASDWKEYSRELGTSTNLKGMPDLTMLGVPEGLQERAPSIPSYPRRFNADARFIWKQMIQDKDFQTRMRALDTFPLMWHCAIVEFLTRCNEFAATPFSDTTLQNQNDNAITALQSARISLCKFVDGIGLFEKIKIQKAWRDYKIREKGFAIYAWATVRRVADPSFEKWLTQAPTPRLTRSIDLKYRKMIQPNVEVWVRFPVNTRVMVGYEILIAHPISIPGKRLATRKEIDAYIDKSIWLPLVRSFRFKNLGMRIF